MSEAVHKILKRAIMPDGTKIQIEDWKEVFPNIFKTIIIAAYPISKHDNYKGFATYPKRGQTFRLALENGWTCDANVYEKFDELVRGNFTLEELSEHFKNDNHDYEYFLGMKD